MPGTKMKSWYVCSSLRLYHLYGIISHTLVIVQHIEKERKPHNAGNAKLVIFTQLSNKSDYP